MKTSVLEFKLLESIFCFNTQNVEYVFDLEEYESVEGFHESVIGITKYNHDVMLLIDTAKLYSNRSLNMDEQKSVVVIKDDDGRHYGMLVDEITKLEEIESVKLSVDLNTEDMVVNHYKDCSDDEIVSEIHPLPLFKKYKIPSMASKAREEIQKAKKGETKYSDSYLLFKINEHSYAIGAKYVKEVLEKNSNFFRLPESDSKIKGAMAVRDEVISVAEIEQSSSSSDILILEIAGKKLGIAVDDVYDIESFLLEKIETIRENESGVCGFYNHKGNVVALLNPLFFMEEDQESAPKEQQGDRDNDQRQKYDYLIFFIDGKKFSINMHYVRQVVETETLQKTESSSIVASENVAFITTWKHRAVNIISLDKELELSVSQDSSQSIFVEYDEHTVAFMVDDIDNIVYVTDDEITKTSAQEQGIINGAIMYDGEVVVTLSEKQICSLG